VLGKLLEARLGLGEEALGGLYTRLFGQVEELLDEIAAGRLTLMQQFPPQKFLSQKQRLRPDLKKVLRKLLPVNQYTVTQT
jgi:hypothetical protein